jgi:secreted trypsin-like serine protease
MKRFGTCFLLILLFLGSFGNANGADPLVKQGVKVEAAVNTDWIVSLSIRNVQGDFISFCAAVIVDSSIALTAAHCLDGCQGNSCGFEVTSGKSLKKASVIGRVAKLGKHPSFGNPSDDYYSYDVAYIVLDTKTNGKYAEISTADIVPNTKALILGWGKDGAVDNNTASTINTDLKFGKVETVPTQDCIDSFRFQYAEQSTICTKPVTKNEACAGDSGGPLIEGQTLDTPKVILLGIIKRESQACEDASKGRSAYTQAKTLNEIFALAKHARDAYFLAVDNGSI